jgi:signal transduction histidine kinase
MAYRSIKRVIGETSLERKCRFLFGACLSVLLFVTFWWVEHIAEDLVKGTTVRKGNYLVDTSLLRYHWELWERDEVLRELAEEMYRDLQTEEYDYRILALEEEPGTELPESPAEEEIVRKLKAEFQERLRDSDGTGQTAAGTDTGASSTGAGRPADPQIALQPVEGGIPSGIELVYDYRPVPRDGQIHYYQPVYWKNSCARCHDDLDGGDAFSRADQTIIFGQGSYPFRVVKVIIPDEETQDAITWNRAILWAIGILTVFLAMVILYVIIRYVVIKPLQHLRDVSEEISRGNKELRAEIHTNDEFEELASAFNRMLRHLTEAQVELQQVNADLDAKLDQLAQLNMRLYEMNRLKSDFLANMSHELRTPLNSIIGFSEVLGGIDSLSDRQKRYAYNIRKSGRLLLDMINDILDLAKIEAGKMDVRLSDFQIAAVVNAQCDMVRSLTEEKNIGLECHFQPGMPPIHQDQGKLQQILINLLSNAIKFTPEGGRITVSVHIDQQDQLVLSVADTGVGIAEEDREIVFEKFRQSSQAIGEGNLTREYSGTGLGLSIVRELCKLLGGEVTFDSELGKGSTFYVRVPSDLRRPEHHQSAIDSQLDELVDSQRFAAQRPSSRIHDESPAAATP